MLFRLPYWAKTFDFTRDGAYMKSTPIVVMGVFLWCTLANLAKAGPAHFWISTSLNSSAPEAPVIDAPVGQPIKLYIWASLGSDNNGLRTLQDVSLDVVTQIPTPNPGSQSPPFSPEPDPIIDFIDGTFKVYNDAVGTSQRFAIATDSFTPATWDGPVMSDLPAAQISMGHPDAVRGLGGFNVGLNLGIGIGAFDKYRVGSAWRVAEFQVQALRASGTNTLFLQVGESGIMSSGTDPTVAEFGTDTTQYDGSCLSATAADQSCLNNNWEHSLAGDTFDLKINGSPFKIGDFNRDGVINSADYSFWRSKFGTTVSYGASADGNYDGIVDMRDYVVWRNAMSSGSGTSNPDVANVVPEPNSLAALLFCSILLRWRTLSLGRGRRGNVYCCG